MSAEKYPDILPHQMEAIAYLLVIFEQILHEDIMKLLL